MIVQHQYPFDDRKPKSGLIIVIISIGLVGCLYFFTTANTTANTTDESKN